MSVAGLIAFLLSIPLAAALLAAISRIAKFRDAAMLTLPLLLLLNLGNLLYIAMHGDAGETKFFIFSFFPDPLGMILAMTLAFLWLIISLFAVGDAKSSNSSYTRTACGAFSILGLALAGNFLTVLLFYALLLFSFSPATPWRKPTFFLSSLALLALFIATLNAWHLAPGLEFTVGGILPKPFAWKLFSFFLLGTLAPCTLTFFPASPPARFFAIALLPAVALFILLKIILYIFGAAMPYLFLGCMLVAIWPLAIALIFTARASYMHRHIVRLIPFLLTLTATAALSFYPYFFLWLCRLAVG